MSAKAVATSLLLVAMICFQCSTVEAARRARRDGVTGHILVPSMNPSNGSAVDISVLGASISVSASGSVENRHRNREIIEAVMTLSLSKWNEDTQQWEPAGSWGNGVDDEGTLMRFGKRKTISQAGIADVEPGSYVLVAELGYYEINEQGDREVFVSL